MHYALVAKFGIAAALTVGLASPATALAAEPHVDHAAVASVTSNSAGNITLP